MEIDYIFIPNTIVGNHIHNFTGKFPVKTPNHIATFHHYEMASCFIVNDFGIRMVQINIARIALKDYFLRYKATSKLSW